MDQGLSQGVGWLENNFDPKGCTHSLASHSAGGRKGGRVLWVLLRGCPEGCRLGVYGALGHGEA